MTNEVEYLDPSRDQALERPLPNSAEAERAILGAILLYPALLAQAVAMLKPADFYVPTHRRIFVAMIRLMERDKEITPVLIGEELKKDNALEVVGGVSFITNLTDGVPHSTSIAHYAKVVRGKALLRNIITAANKITAEALEDADEAEVIAANAEKTLSSVVRESEADLKPVRRTFAQVADGVAREFAEWREGKTRALRTGIPELDSNLKLNGFARGELIYVGAGTSRGKTALCLQIAGFQAEHGHPVVMFSLEMSAEALFMRSISRKALVENWKIRPDMFTFPETVERVTAGFKLVKQIPLIMYDRTRSLSQIEAFSRDEVRYHNAQEIVVDYAQLVDPELDRASRERQVAEISIRLKSLAKALDVPVVATSVLSRVSTRQKVRPELDDMRESGQLEYDADLVLYPWCEKVDDSDVLAMKLYCPKQRNGRANWEEDIDFDKTYQRFMTAQMYADAGQYDREQPRVDAPLAAAAVEAESREVLATSEPVQERELDELDDFDFNGSEGAW